MSAPSPREAPEGDAAQAVPARRASQGSQASDDSHTALDFIRSQMQLEADAREALPYSIETCTQPLGPLRQSIFACLTCTPASQSDTYDDCAGVCYACSVQCHGEHQLVEIFNKRNFVCDCGTTRFPAKAPCALRFNDATRRKGGVAGTPAAAGNEYNQNFRNKFCGCAVDYDPFQQKGTMFQCLGLGTHKTGGCGEDWWHPGCVVGVGANYFEKEEGKADAKSEGKADAKEQSKPADSLPTISEDAEDVKPEATGAAEQPPTQDVTDVDADDEDPPMPEGFPEEEEFEGFICYKCVDAFPWIKRYAGSAGFLKPVFYKPEGAPDGVVEAKSEAQSEKAETDPAEPAAESSRKRKAEDDADADGETAKKPRSEVADDDVPAVPASTCKFQALPPAPAGRFSLFFTESFREHICRCDACFPLVGAHPQLLEEEETYEPPVSEDGDAANDDGQSAHGSGSGGSLYERGESALRNVDRVRAIEGVMAYNHLKDKLKPFFQQFAESGEAISADDIKSYFAKLRGDEQAMQDASEAAAADHRREQSGY